MNVALWLNQVRVLTVKELKQLVKDRALFAFVVYIFTVDLMIAAGAASLDLNHSPLAVLDADRSAVSRDLVGRFRPPHFERRFDLTDLGEASVLLDRGDARAVLVLPGDFSEELVAGRTSQAQLLIDTAQANQGYLVSSYAERIAAEFSQDQVRRNLVRSELDPRRLPAIEAQARYAFNASLNEVWFNTISEMLTMITIVAVLLPAAALVREKERGTIEQLLVAPLSPLQLVLSKVLAMVLVMLVGVSVAVFGVLHGLYDVPLRGSHAAFLLVVALFAMASAGVGIVAASFARTSGQMGLVVLLIVMPMVMLSGTWNVTESMPPWLQALIELSPLRHFIVLAYGLMIRGADLGVLWPSLLKMVALGSVLFVVGVMRFRRQFR